MHHDIKRTYRIQRVIVANIPKVFADRQGDAFAFKFEGCMLFGRFKISVLIKDIIGREQCLMLQVHSLSVVQKIDTVVKILSFGIWIDCRTADYYSYTM